MAEVENCKREIRVVICAHDSAGGHAGGPNTWIQRLLPDLIAAGVRPTVLVLSKGLEDQLPLLRYLREAGIDARFFNVGPKRYIEPQIRWLAEILNEITPDVFVPHLCVAGYYVAAWAKRAGIPSVAVLHSDDAFYRRLAHLFVRGEEFFKVDAVVAVSKFIEDSVAPAAAERRILLTRIPCGVSVVEESGKDCSGPLRVAYVGRFRQEQKRVLDVTAAFCDASRRLPHAEFTLLGNGPEKSRMEALIADSGASDRVKIAEAVPPHLIPDFLARQHVLVLLSDYEGLPIALQEAMVSKVVPVCLQERSGIAELIRHEENGLIVRDRSHDFIDALVRLDSDRALMARLGESARDTIVDGYSAEAQHRMWADFLRDVANLSERKQRVVLPWKLPLQDSHPDFNGEDVRLPPWTARMRNEIADFWPRFRLFLRPRARLRALLAKER